MFRSWPYLLSFFVLIAYCAWISGPYIRSIIVRDAVITTWSNLATTAISGTITFEPIEISGEIASNGLLATISNNHISKERVDAAALKVALTQARHEHAQDLLEEIESLEDDRRATKADYAVVFRRQLDLIIENIEAELEVNAERLAVIQSITDRKKQLASRGSGSVGAAEEELLRLADIKLEIKTLRSDLAYARQRRMSADHGTFIDSDGDDPGWARGNRIALKLEKKKARHDARELEIELVNAQAQLEKAKLDYSRRSTSKVTAPPGKILWRKQAVSGMSVAEGTPVAEWIDCTDLLVDMPVSDAEASLITQSDVATVILEGENLVRKARVVLVRGSAATLGREELVSLAKGRTTGEAQVLLKLDANTDSFQMCPVGRAAYVDIQGVGVFDVLRARLRL